MSEVITLNSVSSSKDFIEYSKSKYRIIYQEKMFGEFAFGSIANIVRDILIKNNWDEKYFEKNNIILFKGKYYGFNLIDSKVNFIKSSNNFDVIVSIVENQKSKVNEGDLKSTGSEGSVIESVNEGDLKSTGSEGSVIESVNNEEFKNVESIFSNRSTLLKNNRKKDKQVIDKTFNKKKQVKSFNSKDKIPNKKFNKKPNYEIHENRGNVVVKDNDNIIGYFSSKFKAKLFINILKSYNHNLNIFNICNVFEFKSKYYIFSLSDGCVKLNSVITNFDRVGKKVADLNNKLLNEHLKKVEDDLFNEESVFKSVIGKTSENVFYIYDYYPKKVHESRGDCKEVDISKKIWDYKNWVKEVCENSQEAMDKFTKDLEYAVNELSDKIGDTVALIAVPSSHPFTVNSICKSIERISNGKNILDYSHVLERNKLVPEAHLSEFRNTTEDHYRSVNCNQQLLNDCVYVLMDDVISSGITWRACRDILCNSGANKNNIVGLAIGRTVRVDYDFAVSSKNSKELKLKVYKHCLELMKDGKDKFDAINSASYNFGISVEDIEKWFFIHNWDVNVENFKKMLLSDKIREIRDD